MVRNVKFVTNELQKWYTFHRFDVIDKSVNCHCIRLEERSQEIRMKEQNLSGAASIPDLIKKGVKRENGIPFWLCVSLLQPVTLTQDTLSPSLSTSIDCTAPVCALPRDISSCPSRTRVRRSRSDSQG